MKPNASARRTRLAQGDKAPGGVQRGRILIVEPDPLTQWSLKAYLRKWFTVDSASSIVGADRILETQPVDALVVSEELPSSALASLEQRAHGFNARVAIVRTVTDSGKPRRPGPHSSYLEKPFELARLAQLLGIPPDQLPREE